MHKLFLGTAKSSFLNILMSRELLRNHSAIVEEKSTRYESSRKPWMITEEKCIQLCKLHCRRMKELDSRLFSDCFGWNFATR